MDVPIGPELGEGQPLQARVCAGRAVRLGADQGLVGRRDGDSLPPREAADRVAGKRSHAAPPADGRCGADEGDPRARDGMGVEEQSLTLGRHMRPDLLRGRDGGGDHGGDYPPAIPRRSPRALPRRGVPPVSASAAPFAATPRSRAWSHCRSKPACHTRKRVGAGLVWSRDRVLPPRHPGTAPSEAWSGRDRLAQTLRLTAPGRPARRELGLRAPGHPCVRPRRDVERPGQDQSRPEP